MEKKLFQNTMAHIKMPLSCEEKILRSAEEISHEHKPDITVKTRRRSKVFTAAAAACICVAVAGAVTVSAANGNDWLAGFFRVPEWSGEPSEITQQREDFVDKIDGYVSPINNFKAEGWNADKFKPVGAIYNGNILYAAFCYTTPEEDGISAEYISAWNGSNGIELSSEGEKIDFNGVTTHSQIQEDGSAIIYVQICFSDFAGGRSIDASVAVADTFDLVNSDKEPADEDLCRLSFSVDSQKNPAVATYYLDEKLEREIKPLGVNAFVLLKKADVNMFFLTLSGEQGASHPYSISDTDVYVMTGDGSEVESAAVECVANFSTHMQGSGECTIIIEYPMPIDPAAITAVKLGDHTITLKD